MCEDEGAGAERRLGIAGRKAVLADGGGLLVPGDAANRDGAAEWRGVGRGNRPCAVDDHRQGGTRHAFIPTITAGSVEGVNVRNVSQGAAPGGDPSGGGLFDPAALGGQSKSVDLIPLPRPLLPPKDDLEF